MIDRVLAPSISRRVFPALLPAWLSARTEVCEGLDGGGIGLCIEWPAGGR